VALTEEARDVLVSLNSTNLLRWQRVARWLPESHREYKITGVQPRDAVHVYSDASSGKRDGSRIGGWGLHIVHPNGREQKLNGAFCPADDALHISVKEAIACVIALEMSGAWDCFLVLHTDNMSVKNALSRYHTSKAKFRAPLMLCVQWQIDNNVALSVKYIRSQDNFVSDEGSRTAGTFLEDRSDVQLSRAVFEELQIWAGTAFSLDLCANVWNRRTRRFVGRVTTGSADQAGTDCWSVAPVEGEFCWVNPPWALVGPLWRHLQSARARGVFLLPQQHRPTPSKLRSTFLSLQFKMHELLLDQYLVNKIHTRPCCYQR
jgi:hypothetical protein